MPLPRLHMSLCNTVTACNVSCRFLARLAALVAALQCVAALILLPTGDVPCSMNVPLIDQAQAVAVQTVCTCSCARAIEGQELTGATCLPSSLLHTREASKGLCCLLAKKRVRQE